MKKCDIEGCDKKAEVVLARRIQTKEKWETRSFGLCEKHAHESAENHWMRQAKQYLSMFPEGTKLLIVNAEGHILKEVKK